MDEIIKEELQQGEKILWSGKTENFDIFDATNKKPIILRAVLIIGIVSFVCAFYAYYALSGNIELKPALIWLALFCAALGAVSGYTNGKKLKKMKYVITNQRIISCVEVPKALKFSDIKEVEFKTDADGHTSVLFGKKAINAKEHQRRSLALLDPYIDEDTGFCSRFVMYAVPDAEQIKKLIGQYTAI